MFHLNRQKILCWKSLLEVTCNCCPLQGLSWWWWENRRVHGTATPGLFVVWIWDSHQWVQMKKSKGMQLGGSAKPPRNEENEAGSDPQHKCSTEIPQVSIKERKKERKEKERSKRERDSVLHSPKSQGHPSCTIIILDQMRWQTPWSWRLHTVVWLRWWFQCCWRTFHLIPDHSLGNSHCLEMMSLWTLLYVNILRDWFHWIVESKLLYH